MLLIVSGTLRNQGSDGRANFDRDHARYHMRIDKDSQRYGLSELKEPTVERWRSKLGLKLGGMDRQRVYAVVELIDLVVHDEHTQRAMWTRTDLHGLWRTLSEALDHLHALGGTAYTDDQTDYRPNETIPEDYYAL